MIIVVCNNVLILYLFLQFDMLKYLIIQIKIIADVQVRYLEYVNINSESLHKHNITC